MKRIDLKDSRHLHKALASLHSGNAMILTRGKEECYAVLPIADFEMLQEAYEEVCENNPVRYGIPAEIRLVNRSGKKLTSEEYEKIKQQLISALETLKPDERN